MKPIKLDAPTPTQQTRLQQSDTPRLGSGAPATPSLSHGLPDQVSVSSRAEGVQHLIARSGEFGDIRQGRVDSLRQALDSGQYQVSSSDIADAIIRDESGSHTADAAHSIFSNS